MTDKIKPIEINDQPDQKILEKYDTESRYRKFAKGSRWAIIFSVIAIAMSIVQLYMAGFGAIEAIKMRSIHLGFVLVLIYLMYPGTSKSRKDMPTLLDIVLAILSIVVTSYLVLRYDAFAISGGFANQTDYIMGLVTIILVLEASRRCVGKELTILAITFLLYAYFGRYISGSFGHQGYSFERIIEQMYLSTNGIFGIALGVSATYIFLFILFGAFLGESGMAKFINQVSMGLAGRSPGGPAKVSVFASGVMGTINGSAVANVASTGAFTIPLMKSIGYRPQFAGAVEAVASTGGQIMPPIMGAAAFIMAEVLGVPFRTVMFAAIIPAVLYYLATYTMVHLEALRTGLKGLPKEMLPNVKEAFKERGHLALPLAVIVYLLVLGVTPTFAAFWGIVAVVIVSFFRKTTRMSIKGFLNALETGARGAVAVAIACAVVGFIIGTTSLTSFGIVLGDNIVSIAQGNVILTLVLVMITCIILGMGMPTTAVYIVAATMAAPILIRMGIDPLAAHLFVFYFGNLSNVTPPVALAAFTGAGIAGANPSQVGWLAARLAAAGFIIPYMWIYSPELILQGETVNIVIAAITAMIGVIALGIGVQGYMLRETKIYERIIITGAAFIMIMPGLAGDIIGVGLFVLVYLFQRWTIKKTAEPITNVAK